MLLKIFMLALIILIVGCSEKQEYKAAVLRQLQYEKDVNDYKIDHEKMADCIVSGSSKKMEGYLDFDPVRSAEYKKYTKMIDLNKAVNIQEELIQLRKEFGDGSGLASAHANYSESLIDCMSILMADSESYTITNK